MRYRILFTIDYNPFHAAEVTDAYDVIDMDKLVASMAAAKLLGESSDYERRVMQAYTGMSLRSRFHPSNIYNVHCEEPMDRDAFDKLLMDKQSYDRNNYRHWLDKAKI